MTIRERRNCWGAGALVGLLAVCVAGGACSPPASTPIEEGIPSEPPLLVLVTLDGVRPYEVFFGSDPGIDARSSRGQAPAMPRFLGEVVPSGIFLGRPESEGGVGLGSPLGTSLPNYQALLTGRLTLCLSNECTPPDDESFIARMARAFELPPDEVVTYATWKGICRGTHVGQVGEAVCGVEPIAQAWTERFGAAQGAPTSTDEGVVALGLDRLRTDPPTFLWLSLDESDGAGHRKDYDLYLATLARYDEWLVQIDEALREIEAGGRPVIFLVTTDHGRGSGREWTEHRWNVPGTEDLWIFLRAPEVAERGAIRTEEHYDLRDVRPTLEQLLGLEPETGLCRGRVIGEAFQALPLPWRNSGGS